MQFVKISLTGFHPCSRRVQLEGIKLIPSGGKVGYRCPTPATLTLIYKREVRYHESYLIPFTFWRTRAII